MATATNDTTSKKAAQAAHDAVDRAAETAEHVERKVRGKAEEMKDTAEEQYQRARTQSSDLADKVCRYVDEKPLTALGIAFAAGLVISSILRK